MARGEFLLGLMQVPHSTSWRFRLNTELRKLQLLPDEADNFSARRPSPDLVMRAADLVGSISRDDMPMPVVAAGSDGSIQVKWRKGARRELSFFFNPDNTTEFVLIKNEQVRDGELRQPNQANEIANQLLD
jgi:hypothetical protein